MNSTFPFQPDYAFPPGDTLLETFETLRITRLELSSRIRRSLKTVNQIIEGTAAITPDTALRLEKVTGVRASFWNRAESNFRKFSLLN